MKPLRLISRSRRFRQPATGQVVVESIASIIIFTMMLALVMTITLWLYLQQATVTAAREGARQASLNSDLGVTGTRTTAVNTIKTYVINSVRQLTGKTVATSEINVTGPTGATTGQRTVTVTINTTFRNPVRISNFLEALGADGTPFDRVPLTGTATMRYEE